MSHWLTRLRELDSATYPASEISEFAETSIHSVRVAHFGDSRDFGARVGAEDKSPRRGDALSEAGTGLAAASVAMPLDNTWADVVPESPCRLCCGSLAWVDGWPTAAEACRLCPRCASFPAPTLAAVFERLTAGERRRLDVESADGDTLARTVLEELRGATTVGARDRRATG